MQAEWGGKKHFLDPTYGGYFADAAGNVLSWDEIERNPRKAASELVVFPRTLDCYPDGERAGNGQRMSEVYRPEAVALVRNAGVLRSRVFVLPVLLDVKSLPSGAVKFGAANGDEKDMRSEEVTRKTRCWYLDLLGSAYENFAYELDLTSLSGRGPVTILLKFCKGSHGPARWEAASRAGKITEGAEGPVCAGASEWRIVYEPGPAKSQSLTLRLSQYKEKSYVKLDCITVSREPKAPADGKDA